MTSRNNRSFAAFLILLLAPISQMGIDIHVTTLPSMASSFGVSSSQIQLSTSIYLLSCAVGQLFYGPLADAYGRKTALLIGLGVFIVASGVTVSSARFDTFFVARAFQGLGVTACSVVMKAIATDEFEGPSFGKITNLMVIVWGLAPVVAPVIGAHLQQGFGWRSSFYFLLIYGSLLATVIIFFYRESLRESVLLERTVLKRNVFTILRNPGFRLCCLSLGFCYSILLTFNLCAPFVVQRGFGYSPLFFGNVSLVVGGAFFLGVLANRLEIVRGRSLGLCQHAATACLATSVAMLAATLGLAPSVWILIVPACFLSLLAGLIFPNLMAMGMSLYPQFSGLLSSLLGFLLMTFAGLIMVVSSFLSPHALWPLSSLFLVVSVGVWWSVFKLNDCAEASKLMAVEQY